MVERFTVVAAFQNRNQAEAALAELRRSGFTNDQMGIAAREAVAPAPEGKAGEKGTKVEDIAAAGAAAGGTLGAVAGAVAAGLIPGVGQVISAGLLAGILGGTLIGAAAGGLIGGLVGLGLPEEDARFYDREFASGRAIVAVRASTSSAQAAEILRRCGAYSVSSTPGVVPSTPTPKG